RLARDPRLGDGPSERAQERGLRPRGGDGLGVRHGRRPRGNPEVRGRRHPSVLRQRPALPPAVRGGGMKIPYRWLRDFVETDLDAREVAARLVNAGIAVASVEAVVE